MYIYWYFVLSVFCDPCRHAVTFQIRKLTLAPPLTEQALKPLEASAEKKFTLSSGSLVLRAKIDRKIYSLNEPISVHIEIQNSSKKSIKSLVVLVRQFTSVKAVDVAPFSCKCHVASHSQDFQGTPPENFVTTVSLSPSIEQAEGSVALDGKVKEQEADSLAGSTQCVVNDE
eukprot:m.118665 g.118665  ORF g.118665 m.118665 type:complete len:172 (-) comp13661_c1_seq3:63-578(-)